MRLIKKKLCTVLILITLPALGQNHDQHYNQHNNQNFYNGVRQGGRGGHYDHGGHYDDRHYQQPKQGGIGPGKGALIGGASGAALGAIFGGGLKGTIVGGAAGAGIGAVLGQANQNSKNNNYYRH
jgi:hypothetical protein